MNRPTTLLLTLLMSVLLTGCGQSPRSAAKSFTENLSRGKITEAKRHATEQTGQLLDLASGFGGLPINPDFQFFFVKESVNGNRAVVSFRESKEGEIETIDLVKIDGQWKVHMEK